MIKIPNVIQKAGATDPAVALADFLNVFEPGVLEDIGPQLTCNECEALCNLFSSNGQGTKAKILRAAHALGDNEESDFEEHLELKSELEDRKCRYCGQHSFVGDCGCQDEKGQP
jgi:hypothetical protein